ncbi:hypothetical protein AMJ44_09740 [candidate division WOR-1 bacterium DG_54_3]|uniref:Glycerol-3-phosphate acyltransferase n=1 Tax=candidate division WOR-1 bacterium DG_54_3 TaxID=1703775 RepID=A0A0S7XTA6_UNCSA|nr:MAG: hypothetical protein AMJ44_09740 [candidate division WOR-1 bacterium DG_54_3]
MVVMINLLIPAGYLIGAIPFGYLIAKIWNVDIRRSGSGNIGATNVFRSLGLFPGLMVFALDLAKGTFAIYLAQQMTDLPWVIILTGLATILGHMYSIFLKFKGGRGVSTSLGVLLGIAPDIFIGTLIFAALVIFITRYVSVASMITPILVTVAFFTLKRPLPYTLTAGMVAILIIIRHASNLKRLLEKTEPRVGEKDA